MVNFFRNLQVSKKLGFLVGVFVTGFFIFGLISNRTLDVLKVNGPLYKRIVDGKDIIADVLPPPKYIIESYLVVLQMLDELNKPQPEMAKIKNYINQKGQSGETLKEEYYVRHKYWTDASKEARLEGKLLEELQEKSFAPAEKFYKVRDEQFFPAALAGNKEKAQAIARQILMPLYNQHRLAVDEVVRLSIERNQQDEERARNIIRMNTSTMAFLGVGIVAAVIVLCLIIIRQITTPLSHVIQIAENVAEGKIAQESIPVTSKDEIGQLGGVFNKMLTALRDMVDSAKRIAMGDLTGSVRVRSEKDDVGTAFSQMVQNLKSLVTQINKEVSQVETSSQQLTQATEQIARATAEVAKNSQLAATSSQKAQEFSKQGRTSLEEVLQKIEKIKNAIELSVTNIRNLVARSKDISVMVEVITDIADQTNLLSLNAAIEAARAGEAGRGFAVVASEIRKLADSSQKQAQNITKILQDILSETGATQQAAERGEKEVEEGVHLIENTHKVFLEILHQVEQVAVQMEQIAAIAEETSASTEEVSAQAEQYKLVSNSLKTAFDRFVV